MGQLYKYTSLFFSVGYNNNNNNNNKKKTTVKEDTFPSLAK